MIKIKTTLYTLIIVFLLIISIIFIKPVTNIFRGFQFLLPFIFFSITGFILFLQAKKLKQSKLSKSLIICGISAAAIFPSIVLHNLIYALGVMIFGNSFSDEPLFFILGVVVFPLLFLIYLIKSIYLFKNKNKKKNISKTF